MHYNVSGTEPLAADDRSAPTPPPYDLTPPVTITPDTDERSRHRKRLHHCRICHDRGAQHRSRGLFVIPFLIPKNRMNHISICPCPQMIHAHCLLSYGSKEPALTCEICHYDYKRSWRIGCARALCVATHLLSLGSVVGLVFGLAQLGAALDRLGLGNEAGTKLDGDENWQDQEMQQILEWLQMVHFATGVAGEALLGLVYTVGVCGVIGLDRTCDMLHDILHLQLELILHLPVPSWVQMVIMCVCLTLIGLSLGTYLLFYSWIWACLIHRSCHRILNVQSHSSHV